MKTHEVIRFINGLRYWCKDTGCDDFDRAAENRYMVAGGLFTTMYQRVERWFTHSPLRKPLPDWIPVGQLVEVDKGDWRDNSGGIEEVLDELDANVVGG